MRIVEMQSNAEQTHTCAPPCSQSGEDACVYGCEMRDDNRDGNCGRNANGNRGRNANGNRGRNRNGNRNGSHRNGNAAVHTSMIHRGSLMKRSCSR
jgi:hypothetical protein